MLVAWLSLGAFALHEAEPGQFGGGGCVAPGRCTPPSTKFSHVIPGPTPGQQWNINGGFCGAFTIQRAALAFGAWTSQDLVRKANRNSTGLHFMHGDRTLGYEVVPTTVAATARGLKTHAPPAEIWLTRCSSSSGDHRIGRPWSAVSLLWSVAPQAPHPAAPHRDSSVDGDSGSAIPRHAL